MNDMQKNLKYILAASHMYEQLETYCWMHYVEILA